MADTASTPTEGEMFRAASIWWEAVYESRGGDPDYIPFPDLVDFLVDRFGLSDEDARMLPFTKSLTGEHPRLPLR